LSARPQRPTREQRGALAELVALAEGGETPLTRVEQRGRDPDTFNIEVEIATEGLERADGGLGLEVRERFTLRIPRYFPMIPPRVSVEHDRFLGHPHVLQGRRICVLLDEDQEWTWGMGIVGFLEDLYRWLQEAAAGRFDARTALFHPVGGVEHRTPGCPTIVVRASVAFDAGPIQQLWLRPRTHQRLDLVEDDVDGGIPIVAVHVPAPLSYGAGLTVGGLLSAIAMLRFPPVEGLLTALGAAASRSTSGNPVYFLLAVAQRRDRPDLPRHLVAGRVPGAVADALRAALPARGPIKVTDADLEAPIEWCHVSEERPEVTNRRDVRRPTRHFVGRHAVIWGCGGLGSWIAEFLARAGIARLSLCDRLTPIGGGLLVRQNFVELDVGQTKAEAVASRVGAIRDDLEVEVVDRSIPGRELPRCDVLIDATVNRSVADLIEALWDTSNQTRMVARVFVDRPTCTLGALEVSRPQAARLNAIDEHARDEVRGTSNLESFRVFWDPPGSSDEVLAEPGCSVPTFHGSAADLAAMAGVFVNLIGPHLETELTGCHLVALPHGWTASPPHLWIPR
jgi:hypothetical protein